jgi:hypothetical protein
VKKLEGALPQSHIDLRQMKIMLPVLREWDDLKWRYLNIQKKVSGIWRIDSLPDDPNFS